MSGGGQKIVLSARSWLGTPFKHQGRVKQVGCDCIGLLVGVVGELGLKDERGMSLTQYDQQNYARVPDGKLFKNTLDNVLSKSIEMQAGNVLLMKFHREPQHVAIVGADAKTIIHCYQAAGKVVEHRLDELWRKRIVKIYSL
jgi:NlpC/P60 family putative phage cell wall peptidase